MKTHASHETGTTIVILEHFTKQRFPITKTIKDKVDNGERLSDWDIAFLDQVFSDAKHLRALGDRHPEYKSIANKTIGLYYQITSRALENEKRH